MFAARTNSPGRPTASARRCTRQRNRGGVISVTQDVGLVTLAFAVSSGAAGLFPATLIFDMPQHASIAMLGVTIAGFSILNVMVFHSGLPRSVTVSGGDRR